jgi:hypothetical protein
MVGDGNMLRLQKAVLDQALLNNSKVIGAD